MTVSLKHACVQYMKDEGELNLLHNLWLHSEACFKEQNGSITTFYPNLTAFTYQRQRLMLQLSIVFCVVLYIQPEEQV